MAADESSRAVPFCRIIGTDTCMSVAEYQQREHKVLNGIQCLQCEQRVTYRRAHKRRRFGSEESVSGHFMHIGSGCRGESVEHKYAKWYIRERKPRIKCTHIVCGHTVHLDWGDESYTAACEISTQTGRIADVAITEAATQKVVVAVEVLHTHAVDALKELNYESEQVAWLEVTTDAVVAHASGERDTITAIRMKTHESCQECDRQKEKRTHIQRLQEWESAAAQFAAASSISTESIVEQARECLVNLETAIVWDTASIRTFIERRVSDLHVSARHAIRNELKLIQDDLKTEIDNLPGGKYRFERIAADFMIAITDAETQLRDTRVRLRDLGKRCLASVVSMEAPPIDTDYDLLLSRYLKALDLKKKEHLLMSMHGIDASTMSLQQIEDEIVSIRVDEKTYERVRDQLKSVQVATKALLQAARDSMGIEADNIGDLEQALRERSSEIDTLEISVLVHNSVGKDYIIDFGRFSGVSMDVLWSSRHRSYFHYLLGNTQHQPPNGVQISAKRFLVARSRCAGCFSHNSKITMYRPLCYDCFKDSNL